MATKKRGDVGPAARYLVFHGSVVLLIGLLCGAPYGRAINRGAAAERVSAWRLAHLSLPLGAILMFAVAPLLSPFTVARPIKQLIAILLIASAYSFCVALPLGAMTGERGLSYSASKSASRSASGRGPLAARVVFVGNALGAATSLLAALLLVYAAFESL